MKNILLILSLTFLSLPSNGQQENIAFTHVNVITMENELVLKDQTVVIKNGLIIQIGSNLDVSKETQQIDGTGKFLMPGISEMHAHIPGNQNGTELAEETLFLYLSNGVTLIRGMLGQPYHLQLRDQVLNGEVLGPRIYTSGPSMNGNSVKSVEQAIAKVEAQKNEGYDFLKLHPGLTMANFEAITKTANELGIPYSGHVSIEVGVRVAIESKYGSIDHIDGYVEGLVPADLKIDPESNGFFGINFTDLADESLLPDLVSKSKAAGVWIVPTHALMDRWAGPTSAKILGSAPEMKYMNPNTVARWVQTKKSVLGAEDYDSQKAKRFIELRHRILKSLSDAGVGILLGSDAPQVFSVPGFSLHHEMQAMVEAGMSNYEILLAGTVNPAVFFNDEDEYGKVKVGLSANLMLLDANPLTDIGNMSQLSGVMVRGKWLSKEEIKHRLIMIEEKYSR